MLVQVHLVFIIMSTKFLYSWCNISSGYYGF